MAFGLPKHKKQDDDQIMSADSGDNDDVFPVSKSSSKEPIGFLQPKKDAKKDSLNDPFQQDSLQKNAYHYTLKTLNALKIVSPIMSAIMQRPGVDANNEDMTDSFRKLISEVSDTAQTVCEKLNIDSTKERNFWIRNVLEKSFAEILHDQWVTDGKTDVNNIVSLIDVVISFSANVSEKTHYDEIPEESLVKLAGIKAMLPVLKEANTFNLYRNLENDIETIMTKLFNTATEATKKLADDYANEQDRSKLFYMIMQEAGELYAASWRCEGSRITRIMTTQPKDKLKGILEKYQANGGFPLDKVEHDFDKYFDKMVVITEKLVLAQKGTISSRLKK